MLMNPDMDNFMQKFFQTNRLEEADVMNMEQMVLQYPYYAPLQYILAKKYRQVDNNRYKIQITKTAIFFSNPHWLNDLLLSNGKTSSKDNFVNTGINVTEPVEDILPAQNDDVSQEESAEQKTDETLNVEPQDVIDENRAGDDFELTQPITEVEEDQILAEQDEPEPEEPVRDILPVQNDVVLQEEHSEQEIDVALNIEPQEVVDENGEPATGVNLQGSSETLTSEPLVPDAAESLFSTAQPEFPDQEIIPAELQEDISQEIPESFPEGLHEDEATIEKQSAILEPGSDLPEQYEKGNDITIVDASVEEATSVSNPMDLEQEEEKNSPVSGPDMDAGKSNIAPEKMEAKLPAGNLSGKFIKPGYSPSSDSGNLPLIPIEPLYAIDYFASQGIKLRDEDGKDKLSQKLRSFTEWLKTMKRIHPEKLEQEMDPQTSTVIQHIAEHSNELDDVVTEAMAEVYARQGLRSKAAEVYQKLSLLNPNKRAYFAARISKLKET